MIRIACLLVLLNLLSATTGCSFAAKKTPTPAAQISDFELARMPPVSGERFYLILFGSHDLAHRPAFTHTWATLVRATDQPGAEPALDVHTISWMPATLDIHPLRFRVEPGVNLDLHRSIQNALQTKQNIAMWGPYQVSHALAYRFLVQKQFLDSGAVGYQCVDNIGEAAWTGTGCDCIHAITDMDPIYPRWRYPLAFYGQTATRHLVRRLMHSPIFIDPPQTHDWLIPRLGLNQYSIDQRPYRGRFIPYEPGAPGLQAVPARVLPGIPILPKEPTRKTAPAPVSPGK